MLLLRVALVLFASSPLLVAQDADPILCRSPLPMDRSCLTLSGQAVLHYSVSFHGKPLIDPSELGLDLQGQPRLVRAGDT